MTAAALLRPAECRGEGGEGGKGSKGDEECPGVEGDEGERGGEEDKKEDVVGKRRSCMQYYFVSGYYVSTIDGLTKWHLSQRTLDLTLHTSLLTRHVGQGSGVQSENKILKSECEGLHGVILTLSRSRWHVAGKPSLPALPVSCT